MNISRLQLQIVGADELNKMFWIKLAVKSFTEELPSHKILVQIMFLISLSICILKISYIPTYLGPVWHIDVIIFYVYASDKLNGLW